jgi:omega-6 fatty acid desaturase (delta-12 desaturase)
VHHLSSGVPFYRLPDILRTYPELREVGRLTLWASFACVRLALWDEETRRLLSFREARAAHADRSGAASGGGAPYLSLNASDPILASGESK